MTPKEKKAAEAASDKRVACLERQIHELLETHILCGRDTIIAGEMFLSLAYAAALNATNGDAVKSRDVIVNRLNAIMPPTEKGWRKMQAQSQKQSRG